MSLDSTTSLAFAGSRVGGILILTLTVVLALITFPAEEVGGIPSIPIIVMADHHVLFKYISFRSFWRIGQTPSSKCMGVYRWSPSRLDIKRASS